MKNNYIVAMSTSCAHIKWERLVVFILLLVIAEHSFCQSFSNSHPVEIEQLETDNDYRIKYRMSLPNSFDKCNGHHWEKNIPMRVIGSEWQEFGDKHGGWGSRTITVDVYPNTAISLGAKYWSSSTLFNCHQWSQKVRYMKTSKLKQPFNFSHLYEEEEKRVVLRWKNATNVPNDKYKVQIRRTNLDNGTVENFEVNGGTTSYTDNLRIVPGAKFKYQIRTHHPGGYRNAGLSTCGESNSSWISREVVLPGIINDFGVDTRRNSIQFSWKIRNTIFHNIIRLEYKDGASWGLIEEVSSTTDQYTWTPSFALIPGDVYEFRVRAMDQTTEIQRLQGHGGLSANGVLSGHVKINNSEKGVPNVPLKLEADVTQANYVAFEYFEYSTPITGTNALDNMEPKKTGIISTFNTEEKERSSNFGFIFTSWIYIPKEGNYTFHTNSDDGSRLYIDDRLWVNNDGGHPMRERSHIGFLDEGYHEVRIKYYQNGGGNGFEALYEGPGISKREIPSSVLFKYRSVVHKITTDQEGYFYLDELYYGEESKFIVTYENDSDIRPDTIRRTLSVTDYKQDDIRFEDFSSIPVYGEVRIGECPIDKAKVVFNGQETDTETSANGHFEYIIQSPDPSLENTLDVKYQGHTFDGAIDIDLVADVNNENNPHVFMDTQKDSLILSVLTGCGKPLADEAVVELFTASSDGSICKSMLVTLDNSGIDTLYIPASKYVAKVVDLKITNPSATPQDISDFTEVKPNIIGEMGELTIDLTQRDTVKHESIEIINEETGEYQITEEVIAINLVKSPFVFRQDIDLNIEGEIWKNPTCSHVVTDNGATREEQVYVLEQSEEYPLKFKLQEKYDYYRIMSHRCGVESATLLINDNISDREMKERTIIDGTLEYTMIPGEANLEGEWDEPRSFQKNISVVAEVDNYTDELFDQEWGLVTGHKILEPTFITSELALPEFILHDPPGDGSYSYLEEGSTITTGVKYSNMLVGGAEVKAKGLVQLLKGPVCLGLGGYATIKAGGGVTNNNSELYTTTFSEKITTSKGKIGPGEESDVIIGSGINFIYSKSKELAFDCLRGPSVSSSYTVSPGFQTRYMLSVYHVRNHILPTLDSLLVNIQKLETKVESEIDLTDEETYLLLSKDLFVTSKANWKSVLSENRRQIFTGGNQLSEKEHKISNLTFNGGNTYEYKHAADTTITDNKTKIWEVNVQTGIALKLGDKDAKYNVLDFSVGAYFKANGKDTDVSKTVTKFRQGFHLSDKSVGDFYTVDITRDPTYDTFLFQTVSGRSSCPVEAGTQARDRSKLLAVSNPKLMNLPKGKEAIFKVRIDNDSQSEEGRVYTVNSITGQEDGTSIYLGASKVQPFGKNYPLYLRSDGSNEYIIKVRPGPKTRALPIELAITPECFASIYKTEDLLKEFERKLDQNPSNVDKISLFASWESNCDQIQIESPADNWIVNTNFESDLPIIISGFDPNSDELSSIEIQYRKAGDFEWDRLYYIDRNKVGDFPRKHMNLQVDTLDAGNYLVRAKTYCSELNVYNYSNVIRGLVDHNPFVITGNNLVSNWLKEENLIVSFSKELSEAEVRLERFDESGNQVEATSYIEAVIWDNQAIIDIPNAEQYEGRKFKVTFESGNTICKEGTLISNDEAIVFQLELASAGWESANKMVMLVKDQTVEFTADLLNVGIEDVEFEIIHNSLSAYITPQLSLGVIPAGGRYPVVFEVNEDGDIPLGQLEGEVAVNVKVGSRVFEKILKLELNVKSLAPDWNQPEDGAYRMHMIAQFTPSSDSDIPLSKDERDHIAAFIDESVVAVSKIYYDESAKRYLAFLTIESDELDATVKFKMWDASENMTYNASETVVFKQGAIKGSYSSPQILHADNAEQSLYLKSGWNFVSFHVEPSDCSLDAMLNTLQQPSTQIKHIQDGFSEYNPTTQSWSGNLSSIDINKAYKIYVDQDDVMRVDGDLIDGSHSVALDDYSEVRYNWVALHNRVVTDIEHAIDNQSLSGGEIIRHNDRFSILSDDQNSWSGNLTYLEPGKGYELFNPSLIEPVNWDLDTKIRFSVNAKLNAETNLKMQAHIVLGGDTLGAYEPGGMGGIPNAVYDHSFLIDGTIKQGVNVTIEFADHGVTPFEFLDNHLQFFMRNDAYVPTMGNYAPIDVIFSDAVLEVFDRDDNLLYQYDYSRMMEETDLGVYSHHWSIEEYRQGGTTEFRFKKVFVRSKDHYRLVAEDSPYRVEEPEETMGTESLKTAQVEFEDSKIPQRYGPNTMTLVSQCYLNGISIDSEDYEVEVMLGEEVIARNFIDSEDATLNALQMFMLRANDGDEHRDVTFRLKSTGGDELHYSEQKLSLEDDKKIGSLENPYRIDFGEAKDKNFNVKVWPNPARTDNTVNVFINSSDFEQNDIQVEVTDVLGKTIFNEIKADDVFQFSTTNWKTGVYFVKVSKNNSLLGVSKLVVR